MRLRDYPELIFDEFPTHYDASTKVFITHLFGAEDTLRTVPMKFCKMFTTSVLANQLKCFLHQKGVEVPDSCFEIVDSYQPFKIRLANNVRLEVMICPGSKIGNSLMLLIRKASQLVYFYSVTHHDNLHEVACNRSFLDWIKEGPELLFLNLRLANVKTTFVDFEKLATRLETRAQNKKLSVSLPLFGYEYVIEQLAQELPKRIALLGVLQSTYRLTNADATHFIADPSEACILMHSESDALHNKDTLMLRDAEPFPLLRILLWSPTPKYHNLGALCALLLPKRIDSVVVGNTPKVYAIPEHLRRLCANYKPKRDSAGARETSPPNVSSTSMQEQSSASECSSPEKPAASQAQRQHPPPPKKRKALYDYLDDSQDA